MGSNFECAIDGFSANHRINRGSSNIAVWASSLRSGRETSLLWVIKINLRFSRGSKFLAKSAACFPWVKKTDPSFSGLHSINNNNLVLDAVRYLHVGRFENRRFFRPRSIIVVDVIGERSYGSRRQKRVRMIEFVIAVWESHLKYA